MFKKITFGIMCFCLFLFLGFPYEIFLPKFHEKILPKITPDRTISIEASKVKPYWLTGITLENFVYRKAGKAVFQCPRLSVRLRVLPLLLNMRSVAFSMDAYSGKVTGWVGQKKKSRSGKISVDAISLKKFFDVALAKDPIPLTGDLSGDLSFSLDGNNIQQSKIDAQFEIEKGKLGPGKIKGFEVPVAIKLDHKNGPLPIKLAMDKGFMSPQIKMANNDARFDVEGRIVPALPPPFSQLDLQLTFFLENKIKDQMPAILFDAILAPGRNADGSFSFKLFGPAHSPRFEPFRK